MANVYVFRVEYDVPERNEFIRNELKKGRLRQGWGGEGSSLLDNTREEWISKKCKFDDFEDNERYYKNKYRNLSNMLNIVEDDIIIIPKTPEYSMFTICRASGKYYFEKASNYSGDDYQHIIPIKTESIREYSYHANENCKNIRAKMRAYQSPVNNVWNELMIQSAEILLAGESNTQSTSTIQSMQRIIKDVFPFDSLQRFRDLGQSEVEKMVRAIFENMGYEFKGKNSYDNNGGDADLIFGNSSFSDLYEIAKNGVEVASDIYVQIKNKTGIDHGDIEGINQLITRAENIPGAFKILISTADDFTDRCVSLAKENGILLIDGNGFLQLMFKYISLN